jgi:ribonuclease D
MDYQSKIEKELIVNLPVAKTDCEIVVVDNPQLVEKAIKELYLSDIVGFDTETKPSFTRGKVNKIALLQISDNKKCYLFRLQKIGKNITLKHFLESTKNLKIGLSLRDDFRMLNRWTNVKPQNFIDLQTFVKGFGIEETSLQKIFAIIFAKKISKREQLSNWEAPILDNSQQIYAATDAWACRQIYLKLTENL